MIIGGYVVFFKSVNLLCVAELFFSIFNFDLKKDEKI